jgi:hypothetical protein
VTEALTVTVDGAELKAAPNLAVRGTGGRVRSLPAADRGVRRTQRSIGPASPRRVVVSEFEASAQEDP